LRITVGHSVPGSAWCDPYRDPICTPYGYQCVYYFEQKTGTIFDTTAIPIDPMIAAILKKLIDEIAVAGM
jgi:hypothetical protein